MIQEKLLAIQLALKAPKGNRNTFGNYNYRNCEDIFEAVKPLLHELGCTLTLSDELVHFESSDELFTEKHTDSKDKVHYYHAGGDRFYIKATATFRYKEELVSAVAYAREEENKKGMDGSQITGASSSYARKYALGGLFLIDNNKDSDATNMHGKEPEKPKKRTEPKDSVCAAEQSISKNDIEAILMDCTTVEEVTQVWWKMTSEQQKDKDIKFYFTARKGQING